MAVSKQLIADNYCLYQGDCCEIIKDIPKKSIGMSIFSPPFCNLYSYSDDTTDMGNSSSRQEFFKHFDFLIKGLYRVMIPGRIVAVHCMDLPILKRDEGYIGIEDFPGDIIRAFKKRKFIQHSPRITIWKDPLIAATRTKSISLAHKQLIKDSSLSGTGIPDYIIPFRKPGENPKPITHKKGLTKYYGKRQVPRNLDGFLNADDQSKNKRSHWIWQQYASPVWFDIRQTNVLPFRKAKTKDDQKHICPLQLDVIERCLCLWSEIGDAVLTPFMGVGSEVYAAVKNKRKGIGIELKGSYYRQAVKNVKSLNM